MILFLLIQDAEMEQQLSPTPPLTRNLSRLLF